MATTPRDTAGRSPRALLFVGALASAASLIIVAAAVQAGSGGETHFYSTAAPPIDYVGPEPMPAETSMAASPAPEDVPPLRRAPEPAPARPEPAPTRIASNAPDAIGAKSAARLETDRVHAASLDSMNEAKARIAACAKTYAGVKDYTCLFFKRERIDGKLASLQTMHMKARTSPLSFYFKFVTPKSGREAIFVHGGYGGKAVVHDVGIGKLLAGTLKLDPLGSMAMEDNRHPITEAGLGHMIDTIVTAWDKELSPVESRVVIHSNARVAGRACTMIESVHPNKRPEFLFHMVKVYIDKEHNLPIRFEAYDWPKGGRAPELVEEYTYTDLKLNNGLTARDFDPNNAKYAFGRF